MGLRRDVRSLDRASYLHVLRAARFLGAIARGELRWKLRHALRAARRAGARIAADVEGALLDDADASRPIVVVALARSRRVAVVAACVAACHVVTSSSTCAS